MLESLLGNEMLYNSWVHYVAHSIFLISNNLLETISNHFDLFLINKDDNQHVFQLSCIGSVNMEAFMANTMSTDCSRKKMNTILKQFLTSLLLLTSNITTIVDAGHGTWITTNLSSYATL